MVFSTGYAYYGEYPASFAACFENKEMYDYLIRRGADPNKQDTLGNTVLHLCVIHNKIVSKKQYLYRIVFTGCTISCGFRWVLELIVRATNLRLI